MRIALTFDDGPSEWTGPILDHLAKHNARATFFVCGHAVEQHPHLIRRMIDEGHEVGNHSYDHPRFATLTDEQMTWQLDRTQEVIHEACGNVSIIWRGPYFDINNRIAAWVDRKHLRHVGATIDPSDWQTADADMIARRVLCPQFRDGAIVDLHDGIPPDGGSGTKTRQPTVDAVQQILARNPQAQFVTASEINRRVEPEKVAVVIVTRGDVPLRDVIAPLEEYPFGAVWVWNNLVDEDLGVYGRYAAIDNADQLVILVVDDDVRLNRGVIEALLANYRPGTITANVPSAGDYRQRYTDSCLVGFGAIFDRELPDIAINQRFCRAPAARDIPLSLIQRTCDVIFTSLTPYRLVDWPFEQLPWSYDDTRMYRQAGFSEERGRVLEACRELRETACA